MAETRLDDIRAWLENRADPDHRAGLARYGIPVGPAIGVPMSALKSYAKQLGPSHDLVPDLWATGIYEARVLAIHLADPARFPRETADAWCRDFDNWALCDTAAFHLFDRTPYRWQAAEDWMRSEVAYKRRAGLATLWGLSVHDKTASDDLFTDALSVLASVAGDEREPVKKAADMALRAVGKRNRALNAVARRTAKALEGMAGTAGWVGRHAGRELGSARVLGRLGVPR